MFYTKQTDYDSFTCIADKCPESCCKGWQIMIDDDSLEKYKELSKTDPRAASSIDVQEQCFTQKEGRCSFLDNDELCHLQRNYGEDMLCNTCRMYPRHIEEFENIREYSLSLSCPHYAQMLLTNEKPMAFTDWEDNEEEEFEDFDYLLYEKLLDSRSALFSVIQNRELKLIDRMNIVLETGKQLQEMLEEGQLFEMDELIEQLNHDPVSVIDESPRACFYNDSLIISEEEKRMFSVLFELETLHKNWDHVLDHTWKELLDTKKGTDLTSYFEEHAIAGEQILMFFMYTYFCGAVYDDWISSKTALSVYSLKWIFYIAFANGDLIRAAYQYAREAEHSDLNLDHLEEFFMDHL